MTALHGRARLHADAVRLTSVGRCRRSVVLCPSEASERATHTRGNVREEEKHAAACAQRSLQSARRGRLCVFAGVRGIIGLAAARVILTQRIRQFFARRLRCHPFIMQSAFSKLALYFLLHCFSPFSPALQLPRIQGAPCTHPPVPTSPLRVPAATSKLQAHAFMSPSLKGHVIITLAPNLALV